MPEACLGLEARAEARKARRPALLFRRFEAHGQAPQKEARAARGRRGRLTGGCERPMALDRAWVCVGVVGFL